MFSNNNNVEEKVIKTGLILGAINLITIPLASDRGSIGLLLTLAMNAFVIYQLHSLGQRRRPGSNLATKAQSVASAYLPGFLDVNVNELENAARNTINGGAAITDEIIAKLDGITNSRMRR